MITLLFIILAAFFKAVADTLSFHFFTSVFRWKDRRFWDPSVSWQYTGFIRFTRYRPDAWHLSNSLMVVCFCCAAAFTSWPAPGQWWIAIIAQGVVYNLSFNLFFDKILRKK